MKKIVPEEAWLRPFVTPMMEDVFVWAQDLIFGGHTGGVIYAPSRTGKTDLTYKFTTELREFSTPSGDCLSETVRVISPNRLVTSEGGFWDWLLISFKHQCAGSGSPNLKRHRACEYLKGLAQGCPSKRLILLVDEAQLMEKLDLGWLADLFNILANDGVQLVVFLVGSYHLSEWKNELKDSRHDHVRTRFFANEIRLQGLTTLSDFRRCLKRYDMEGFQQGQETSFTKHYLREWYQAGERLERYAGIFLTAFEAGHRDPRFEVPMANFVRTVKQVLHLGAKFLDPDKMAVLVKKSGYEAK
jgi:hypothetical protein